MSLKFAKFLIDGRMVSIKASVYVRFHALCYRIIIWLILWL
jgi:hypothetical protein